MAVSEKESTVQMCTKSYQCEKLELGEPPGNMKQIKKEMDEFRGTESALVPAVAEDARGHSRI